MSLSNTFAFIACFLYYTIFHSLSAVDTEIVCVKEREYVALVFFLLFLLQWCGQTVDKNCSVRKVTVWVGGDKVMKK